MRFRQCFRREPLLFGSKTGALRNAHFCECSDSNALTSVQKAYNSVISLSNDSLHLYLESLLPSSRSPFRQSILYTFERKPL